MNSIFLILIAFFGIQRTLEERRAAGLPEKSKKCFVRLIRALGI